MKMFKFKPFSLSDPHPRHFPKTYGIRVISFENDNFYFYEINPPGIWSYNLLTNLWVELISLNNSLSLGDNITGVIKEDNLVKIFSVKNPRGIYESRLHICNLDTKEVVEKNLIGFIPESELIHQGIIYYSNYYYAVLGCCTGPNKKDFTLKIYRLNLDTYTWKYVNESTSLPKILGTSSTVLVVYNNDKIYLFMSLAWNHIRVFDLKTNTWNDIYISPDDERGRVDKILPKPERSYQMSSYVDPDTNDVCFIASNGSTFSVEPDLKIWKFNLTSLKWSLLCEFGHLEHQHWFRRWAGVTSKGTLVICDESHDTRLSYRGLNFMRRVYSTRPGVPKLVDICWEAVLYYHPNLPNESKDDIQIKFGIPWNFLQKRLK